MPFALPVIETTPKCIAGRWEPDRGCAASRPWSIPLVSDAPTSELEARLKTGATTPREELAIAIAIARRKPEAQRGIWYRRATAAFVHIPAPPDTDAIDLVTEAEASLAIAALERELPNESQRQCPATVTRDLFDSPADPFAPESKGAWNELRRRATDASTQLAAINKHFPRSAWSAVALARAGLLFAHLRDTLDACDADTTIDLFSPKEKDFLAQISTNPNLSSKAADIRIAKRAWFESKKAEGLHDVQVEAIRSLAAGLAVARCLGVSNAIVSDARATMAHFRNSLGDETMTRALDGQRDPTDPDQKRSLGANFEVLTKP